MCHDLQHWSLITFPKEENLGTRKPMLILLLGLPSDNVQHFFFFSAPERARGNPSVHTYFYVQHFLSRWSIRTFLKYEISVYKETHTPSKSIYLVSFMSPSFNTILYSIRRLPLFPGLLPGMFRVINVEKIMLHIVGRQANSLLWLKVATKAVCWNECPRGPIYICVCWAVKNTPRPKRTARASGGAGDKGTILTRIIHVCTHTAYTATSSLFFRMFRIDR